MKFLLDVLKGTQDVVCPAEDLVAESFANTLKNIPAVSVIPTRVYRGGDDEYVLIFKDVSVDLFDEYVAALESAGFARYSRTNFDGKLDIHKNSFATYITDETCIDIGYHTKGYIGCGEEFAGGMLIVSVLPRAGLTLWNAKPVDYTPVDAEKYPMTLTQMGFGDYHPKSRSNCYIIRLVDGSFIIHDSAFGVYNDRKVADEIYEVLKKQAPDPENIVISAWIHTHPHNDHVTGFVQFAEKYATDKTITVKQFIHNFCDASVAGSTERLFETRVRNGIEKFGPDVEILKPHAGNVLYYPGVKFNVVYSQEDHLPINQGGTYYYHNATSLVMQMVTDDGCSVLLPGDSPMPDQIFEGKARTFGAIYKWYGSFIESYVLVYPHHGRNSGGSLAANQAIKPKIILLPTTWGSLEEHDTKNRTHASYFYDIEPDVLHEIPNANGLYGWFVAENGVQILHFKDGKATVTTYPTIVDYYNS